MIRSYFKNIRASIIEQLKAAKSSIYVAVAWITDNRLFEILQTKLEDNVDVKIFSKR